MSIIPIINPTQSYTFADYFKLNSEPEDILSYFGHGYESRSLSLPQTHRQLERLDNLKQRLQEILPCVSLTSEMARREFLIAPVLMELIHYTQVKIKVGYSLKINEQLKGELDYFLQTKTQFLVIEAKNADLQRGFTQLAVELIAVEKAEFANYSMLYGAVSMGNIWQFAVLDTQQKRVIQDTNVYRVPADLRELLQIMVGILES
ncbi:MAG: hypothetical protein F6K25_06435 [Okeania sp. SIO2G4]|uniref:hypothetical protein n=1 Tax=unclassified Okeania TaxID=2634635 RepID=UPI0013B871DC|nr:MULTISPECIES: hypothetical protein [unclassified Okeania]NEP08506.1 hypothetical protein [Okeania sp. SIO4D6]NEP44432.1 hypothetical protein [Okeania sp. SIO2H7]NEP70461.1 hypothetical protein [Okeania sp. SIO2G5]NEP92663.1 hypothetical protein [Okeania sp. SIO2F5]NEQ90380.1 hypothetical protein [Okeania sp. SIO2G4]